MARTRPEPVSFAQQLDRLEEIVRRLEAQELDLDEALKLFEEGIERLREARERLTAAIRYSLLSTGKRLRPTLVFASAEAGGDGGEAGVAELAAAVEVVHAYSLVHDDLPC